MITALYFTINGCFYVVKKQINKTTKIKAWQKK